MKKLLVFIGLLITVFCNAQRYSWDVTGDGKTDSIYYYTKGGEDWNNMKVTIDITIWTTEDDDLEFYFGGHDNKVTNDLGVQSWNYYSTDNLGVSIGPLAADTTGTIFTPNADSTRYAAKISIKSFDFKLPAYRTIGNETDSLNYYILWNAYRND